MSFDSIFQQIGKATNVSIPFKQGYVFRQMDEGEVVTFAQSQSLSSRAMSFDEMKCKSVFLIRLNPFRAGLCLSTCKIANMLTYIYGSQSLSSRAMNIMDILKAGIMWPFRPTSQFFWKIKELALDLSK